MNLNSSLSSHQPSNDEEVLIKNTVDVAVRPEFEKQGLDSFTKASVSFMPVTGSSNQHVKQLSESRIQGSKNGQNSRFSKNKPLLLILAFATKESKRSRICWSFSLFNVTVG